LDLAGHPPDPDGTAERRSGLDRRIGQDPAARRILIAEGDATLRDLYRSTLEAHGWVVEVAHDGQSALDKALTSPPDVLLLDTLPDLDGVTILERVLGDEQTQDLAVIVLANSPNEPAMPINREQKVLGTLVKNWLTRDRLSETILALLDRRARPAADRRQSSASS
jgi:DNA-binding response OmpR family regulator